MEVTKRRGRTGDRLERDPRLKLLVKPEDEPLPAVHLLDEVEESDMTPVRTRSRPSRLRRTVTGTLCIEEARYGTTSVICDIDRYNRTTCNGT